MKKKSTFFKKLFFIKSPSHVAGLAALMASFLALSKIAIYWFSGSLVVALSAWDSTIDMILSFMNNKILRIARQEADEDHPYGHGKAESLAGLAQGTLLVGGALLICYSSVQEIYKNQLQSLDISQQTWSMVLFFLILSLISMAISTFIKKNAKRFNSLALMADAQHYQADILINFSTALSISLVLVTQNPLFDPLLALLFAIYVASEGFKVIMACVDEVMDHDVSADFKNSVLSYVFSLDQKILDIHKFRGRKSGERYFFDFHVTLPKDLSFSKVHTMVELIEEKLHQKFNADVIVHADPNKDDLHTKPKPLKMG